MKSTPQTRELAQKVHDYLAFNPHLHDQDTWYIVKDYVGAQPDYEVAVISEDANICNTTMCAAGTIQWMEHGKAGLARFDSADVDNAITDSGNLLGLDKHERDLLFYQMDEEAALSLLSAIAQGDQKKFFEVVDKHRDTVVG